MNSSSYRHNPISLIAGLTASALSALVLVACTQTSSTGLDAGLLSSDAPDGSSGALSSHATLHSSAGGTSSSGASGNSSADAPTELALGAWTEDSLTAAGETRTFVLTVVPGTTYAVAWNDTYQGDGTTSADIYVSAASGATILFDDIDSGFDYPRTFIATSTSVEITVRGYLNSSTGTFALRAYLGSGFSSSAGTSSLSGSSSSSGSSSLGGSSSAGTSSSPGTYPVIPLTLGTAWVSGSLNVRDTVTYTATVAAGSYYTIAWNDRYEGDDTKTADVVVSAYKAADQSANYFERADSGWLSPRSIYSTSTTLVIVVHGFSQSESGSYALQVTQN